MSLPLTPPEEIPGTATMIMSTAVLIVAGVATVQNPDNTPCGYPSEHHQPSVFWICGYRTVTDEYQCAVVPGYNNGNAFLALCGEDHLFTVVALCSCPKCCSAEPESGIGDKRLEFQCN
ncbi:hypothetical protein K503DRAFT_778015 [Rhizopogon vinicolor AM-OR11-026]|uniref:Uncharacterized protein n=1 Tax=Rhizopogon vinicolor AM-OR11-026 TaxID=1314800 RepID=A0A1B7MDZ8_9AGAM|nr:hypothetical protein K503DRAFT_778015 [Rhizopogon vinicolor AM-OR11-026]